MAKHFKRNKKNKRNKGKPKDLRHKMKRTQSGNLKNKQNGRQDSLEGNTDASEEVEPRDAMNTTDPDEDYEQIDKGKVLRGVNGTLDLTRTTGDGIRSRSRRNRTLDLNRSRARMRTRSRRNRHGRSKIDAEESDKNAKTLERSVVGDMRTIQHVKYTDPIHNQLHLLGNREHNSETLKNPAYETEQLGDLKAEELKNEEIENELLKKIEQESERLRVFKIKYGDDFKSEHIKDGDLKTATLYDGDLKHEQLKVCDLKCERSKVDDFKSQQSRGRKIKLQLFEDRRTKRSLNDNHKFEQLEVEDIKFNQIKDDGLKTTAKLKVDDLKSKRTKVDESKRKQPRGRKIKLQQIEDRRKKRSLVSPKLFVDREFDTQLITDNGIKSQSFTDGGIKSENHIDDGIKSERLPDSDIKFQAFTDSGSKSQSLIEDGMKSQLLQKLSTLLTAFETSWRADFLRGYVGQIARLEDRVKAMILCPQLERMYLTRFRSVLHRLKGNPATPLTALMLIYDRLEKALPLTDERPFHVDQEQERQEILATQYLYERERERFLRMFPELEPRVKTRQQVELEATQKSKNQDTKREQKQHDLTNQSLPYSAHQKLLPGVRDFILQAQKTPRPEYYNLFEPIEEDIGPKFDQDDHRQGEFPKVTAHPSSYTSYKCTLRSGNSNSPSNSSKDLLNNIFNRKICLPKDAVTPNNTIFNRILSTDNSNSNKSSNLNHSTDSANSNNIFSNRFDVLSQHTDTTNNNRIYEPIGSTNNPTGKNIFSNGYNDAFHSTDTSNTSSKNYNSIHSTNNRSIFCDKIYDPIHSANDLTDNDPNNNTIFSSGIYDPIQSRNIFESKNILDDLFNKSNNTSCSTNYSHISANLCNASNYQTESKDEMSGDVIRFFRQYEQLYSTRREAVPDPSNTPWNSPEYTSRSYPSPHHHTSFMVDSQPNTPRFYQPVDCGTKTQDIITSRTDHIDYGYLGNNVNQFNENINKFFCNKEYINNHEYLSNNEQDTNRTRSSEEKVNNEYFNNNEHINNVFKSHENTKKDSFKSNEQVIEDFGGIPSIDNENLTSPEHETTDRHSHLDTDEQIHRTGETVSGRSKQSARSLGSKRKLSASRRTMYKTLTRKISRDKILPYKILTRGKTLEDFILESGAQECTTSPKLRPVKSIRSIGERKTKHRTISCSHQRTTSSRLTFRYVSTVSSERKSTMEKSESDDSTPKSTYYSGSSSEYAAGRNSSLSDGNISTVATNDDIQNNALMEFLNGNKFPKDVSRGSGIIKAPVIEHSTDPYGSNQENDVLQSKYNECDRLVSKEWQTGRGDDLTHKRYEWSNQSISKQNRVFTQIQNSENSNQIINSANVSTQSKSSPDDTCTYIGHHGDNILTRAILKSAMSPSEVYSKYARDNHGRIPQEERSKCHSLDSQPWLATWKSNLFKETGVKTWEGVNGDQFIAEASENLSTLKTVKDLTEKSIGSKSSVSVFEPLEKNKQDPPLSVRRTKEPTFDCLSRFKTNLARRISFGNRPDPSEPELHVSLEPQSENPTLDQPERNSLPAELSPPSANPVHRSDKMKLALNAAYESPQAKHCDDFHFPRVRETLKRFRIYRHWDRSEVKTDRQMTVELHLRQMGPWQVFKYHLQCVDSGMA